MSRWGHYHTLSLSIAYYSMRTLILTSPPVLINVVEVVYLNKRVFLHVVEFLSIMKTLLYYLIHQGFSKPYLS